jgi:hypothetical protein
MFKWILTDQNQRLMLGQIFIKWGDKKQYNGALKMYTLGQMRKYKKGAVLITIINIKLRCISWQTKLTSCMIIHV